MKWPTYLALIRHDVSDYNARKASKHDDPRYQEFLAAFKEDPYGKRARTLARSLEKTFTIGTGDHDTPLAVRESEAAYRTGAHLRETLKLPHVVFVSPYERTLGTLKAIARGWPELTDVDIVEERRIREQEHGLVLRYNDWRIFAALHPEQMDLRALEGNFWYRFPQGENVPDVEDRIRLWFDTIIREYAGKRVLVVTHHLTILSIRSLLERWTAHEFLSSDENDPPRNLSLTLYKGKANRGKDGRLVLKRYNESVA
jgi:broad specificity phosphatase PhoE